MRHDLPFKDSKLAVLELCIPMKDAAGLLRPRLNEIQCELDSITVGATCLDSAEFWDLP